MNDLFSIDVGANIGNHTSFFENFLEFDRIIAFEPIIDNFVILKTNIHSPKTVAFLLALGKEFGQVRLLNQIPNNSGTWSITNSEEGGQVVPMVDLDQFCNFHNIVQNRC